jgi:catechol 2,3-dioxygenase-like lactoylglutathione lyase family enzyme
MEYNDDRKPAVTGIGGVFFKSKDPDDTKQWYHEHLGLEVDNYGSLFKFHPFGQPKKIAQLQWSPFPHTTDYLGEADQEFMINYRVRNIEALVDQLRTQGIPILDDIATYDYGKFVYIRDGDGRRVELWEPVDENL